MAILFGVDDHWGPLTLFEEVKNFLNPVMNCEMTKEAIKERINY